MARMQRDVSSIAQRIAQRNQRITDARRALNEATTEAQRAAAVYDEFDAKLGFDQDVWNWIAAPTPAVAAMVVVERISLAEAVCIVQAKGDDTASCLATELLSVLSARDWLALEELALVKPWWRLERAARAARERDRAGSALLLDAEPFDGSIVEVVYRAFGREALASSRGRALAEIAAVERRFRENPTLNIRRLAQLSYALIIDEQRSLLTDLAKRCEALSPEDADVFVGLRGTFAAVALALLAVDEHQRAESLIERALFATDLEPVRLSWHDAHAPLLAALRELATPEQHAQWVSRLRDAFLRASSDGPRPQQLYAIVDGPWRAELQREIRREFDAVDHLFGPTEALSDEQHRVLLRRWLDAPTTHAPALAFLDRFRTDASFAEELLRWRPRQPSTKRSAPSDDQRLFVLIDAARDGNRAAIEAVLSWAAPEEVLSVSEFFVGLSRELVEALLDRDSSRLGPPQDVRGAAANALSFGSDAAIERWRIEHSVQVVRSNAARTVEGVSRDSSLGDGDVADTAGVTDVVPRARQGEAQFAEVSKQTIAEASAAGRPLDAVLDELAPSSIDHFEVRTLALLDGHPWIAAESEHAYRATVRCVELQRALPNETATLQALRTRIVERARQWNRDDWIGVIFDCFGGDLPPRGLAEAIQRRPWSFDGWRTSFARDCVRLGIVDEVLRVLVTLDDERTNVAAACDLLPFASDSAGRDAVGALRERFRADARPLAPDELLPWLTEEDVIAQWDKLVGTSSYSMMLSAPLLAKVGGVTLVDRVGDALARVLAQSTEQDP